MPFITEPATLVTDYLLAAFTAVLAWRLRASGAPPQRWWAAVFAAIALAGVAGGTVHGFRLVMAATLTEMLWVLTLEALLVASVAIIAATYRPAMMLAALAYGGYGVWVALHPRFVFAIAAYGVAALVLAAVHLRRWIAFRRPASAWMLAGVAVSVAAAAVQQSGWAPHRHFNHNDLYHVIQAFAVWALYRGALLEADQRQSITKADQPRRPRSTRRTLIRLPRDLRG
jgi:hypothetical protein